MALKIEIIQDRFLGSFIKTVKELRESHWYIKNCVVMIENDLPIYYAFLIKDMGSSISGGPIPDFNVILSSSIVEFRKQLEEELNSEWKMIDFTVAYFKKGRKYIAFLKKN